MLKFKFLSLGLLLLNQASACVVPVFRYALERWYPDEFPVVIFHEGPLTAQDSALFSRLDSASRIPAYANFIIHPVDLKKSDLTPEMKALWKSQTAAKPPWMVAQFPMEAGLEKPAWSGPLNFQNIKLLTHSPVRQEIAKRIKGGVSSVLVLLESGDKKKDNAARTAVGKHLAYLKKTLKLPDMTEEELPMWMQESEGPQLRLDFSVVSLSRTDAKEQALVQMLLNAFPNLDSVTGEPVILPIFGQGRALEAIVGKDITQDRLQNSLAFLVGSCSCEIKSLNPGVDLLFAANWGDFEGPKFVVDEPLPELTGLSGFVDAADAVKKDSTQSTSKPAVKTVAAATPSAPAVTASGAALPDGSPKTDTAGALSESKDAGTPNVPTAATEISAPLEPDVSPVASVSEASEINPAKSEQFSHSGLDGASLSGSFLSGELMRNILLALIPLALLAGISGFFLRSRPRR